MRSRNVLNRVFFNHFTFEQCFVISYPTIQSRNKNTPPSSSPSRRLFVTGPKQISKRALLLVRLGLTLQAERKWQKIRFATTNFPHGDRKKNYERVLYIARRLNTHSLKKTGNSCNIITTLTVNSSELEYMHTNRIKISRWHAS